MSIESLARAVVEACESEGADYMMAGAFAYGIYGVPRSTKDVDVVISLETPNIITQVIDRLSDSVNFDDQVVFDTLTWGRRHVGRKKHDPQMQVELFELFDDPFVQEQFSRKVKIHAPNLEIDLWVPTAEDVLVQKIRWARTKDIDDARDVLAIQDPANLDMPYIRRWAKAHGSEKRLDDLLKEIKDLF